MKRIIRKNLILAVSLLVAAIPAMATKYIVEAINYQFVPSELNNLKPGDTIRWQWVEGMHTTTSVTIPSSAASWDAELSSASPFFEYVPVAPGDYSYKCTPHEGLGMVGHFSVESVGISEHNPLNVRLNLFPNPASGIVHVSAMLPGEGAVKLSFLDIRGMVVFTQDVSYAGGKLEAVLDLVEYPAGQYFVRLTGRNLLGYRQLILH
jgi:plastocyanin